MTVRRIHSIERFIGLSSDTKPVDAMVGSTFFESDTKKTYVVYEKVAAVAQWVLK